MAIFESSGRNVHFLGMDTTSTHQLSTITYQLFIAHTGLKFQSMDLLTKLKMTFLLLSTYYFANPRRGRLRKLLIEMINRDAFENL